MAHLTVRFNTFVESILRVPPIFVLDEIFKSGFNYPFSLWYSPDKVQVEVGSRINEEAVVVGVENVLYTSLLFASFKVVISLIGE